jgi:inorganic pyrophosphatase
MRGLTAFSAEGHLNVIVESPRGSSAKFKWVGPAGVFALSRPLPSGLVYPCDWGFIPGTEAGDGDPLDAFVMWDGHAHPGVLLPCRPIGVLRVTQVPHGTGVPERNDRIAAVPAVDARLTHISSMADLGDRIRQEIERFFLAVVAFEPKTVRLEGWGDSEEAIRMIKDTTSDRRP